ncbi:MAG: AarF/ABC1/UbiB kinase family protein [Nanoarchaeota archaeon]|nr:AarF/ABC1/UbiB kinase family protein [Nanoarchaeota archaeon]
MSLKKRLRNLQRLRQITNALVKAEMGHVVERLKLKMHFSKKYKIHSKVFKKSSLPRRLREAFENLGGAFVKLGQLLSLRYDLLPVEYCDEFSKLQDDVKPFPYSSAKRAIEKELKQPLKKIFKEFDKEPIAAASVGQVYRARLLNGKEVAVKVQRPKIEEVFETDIRLLYHLAGLVLKHYPEVKDYDPVGIIQEFEKYTSKELDYTLEGKNIETFYNNFKDDPKIEIPRVYWKYTKKTVLVMSFVHGTKINLVRQFSKLKSSRRVVVKNVIEAVTKQILVYKVFHADPHPGNIFLISNNKIAFLDFGIVGRITEEMLIQIENLVIGSVNHDPDLIVRAFVESGSVVDDVDISAFKSDLVDALGDYYNTSLQQINFAGFFLTIFNLARKYKIKVPLNYTLLGKSFITLEGFSAKYYPEFNFVEFMKPKVEALLKKRFGPHYVFNAFKKTAEDFKDMVKNIPSDVNTFIKAIKHGTKINIDIDNKDLRKFTAEMDKSSNRLTIGLIIAALIVAAALLMQVPLEPSMHGIPLIVWFLLGIVGLLVILLIFSIFSKKGGAIDGQEN